MMHRRPEQRAKTTGCTTLRAGERDPQPHNPLNFFHMNHVGMWIASEYVRRQRLMRFLRAIALVFVTVGCTEPSAEAAYVGTWVLADTAAAGGEWLPGPAGTIVISGDQKFTMNLPGASGQQSGDWDLTNDGSIIELMSASGWVGQREPHVGFAYLLIGKGVSSPHYRLRK